MEAVDSGNLKSVVVMHYDVDKINSVVARLKFMMYSFTLSIIVQDTSHFACKSMRFAITAYIDSIVRKCVHG